ncbi:MAG TPA: serine hydrolase domain-containing protein, partial [Gemmatimonadales bacterium]|nr:serine hydrolase domain-containing protein [Gemmatimonadales bacterium]
PIRHVTPMLKPTLALLFLAASSAAAQAKPLAERLDSVAGAGVASNRTVGLVAAVVKGGDTLLMKGYGKADVEWDIAMPADAMFELGSVTKQFTAVALLQLRDEGKLSLDDPITKWLPDFNSNGNSIPLRRLLDHTSGMVGITEMPQFGLLVTNTRFPRDSAYALINRTPFQFKTGEMAIYNNSAFILAGFIVEKASGMSYEDYVEKKLFAPLGMTRSSYCNITENISHRAHGYMLQRGNILRAPTNVHTWPFSAGSLCSTASDMIKWVAGLHSGKVLSPASYKEFITPSKLNDGTPLRYSMGIGVGPDANGLNYIGHGGAIGGFLAEAGWYPDQQMAIVVLMNTNGQIDPGEVVTGLARTVTGVTPPAGKTFTGDKAPYVGKYTGPSRGRDMTITVTEAPDGLSFAGDGPSARVVPWLEGTSFKQGTRIFTFGRAGDSGPFTELRVSAGAGYYILKRQ